MWEKDTWDNLNELMEMFLPLYILYLGAAVMVYGAVKIWYGEW